MQKIIIFSLLVLLTPVANAAAPRPADPAPVATTSSQVALTKEEVSKHNQRGDCWSIVDGYVYNLTNWIDQHPGGASRIISLCGVDGTSNFLGQHSGSSSAKSRLKNYELGKLEVTAIAAPQPTTPASKSLSSKLDDVTMLLESENFTQALSDLKRMDKEFPNNADINNLLGYASRNLMQYKQSASYYTKALRINPNHLGAIEYQGELFLKTKKVTAAKRNLAKLKSLCGVNCPEYLDLKQAIGKR
jgi:cytochrome b involved in lipid metabolism